MEHGGEEQQNQQQQRCSVVIGGSQNNNNGNGVRPTISAGWMLRATRSEHQLPQSGSKQDDRINSLLDEMRPKTSILPKKAHTTNIVDISQLTGRNAIYGSWQERRPMIYGSQQVTLPKYDQLYCNTSNYSSNPMIWNNGRVRNENNSSTNTISGVGKREPPDYSKLVSGRPTSSWQVTCSDMRPQYQAGWLKNSRPLARGTLSPAGYFQELESKNGPNSPIVGGFPAVVPVKFAPTPTGGRRNGNETRESSSDSTLDSAVENEKSSHEHGSQTLSRTTPRQASFMAAMSRHPLKESTSYESNSSQMSENDGGTTGIGSNCDQRDVSSDMNHSMTTTSTTTTPLRRPRGRESSGRRQNASKSMGKLDFDTLRNHRNQHRIGSINAEDDHHIVKDSEEKKSIEESVKMRIWTDKTTGSSSSDQQSAKGLDSSESVDSNHNEAMKMIRRARPKSYVLATSASMQEDVLSSLANEASSSISHDDTTSGRELPSSLMGSTSSIDHHNQNHLNRNQKQNTMKGSSTAQAQPTSRSLNAPHPPAAHRLQRFIALFNTNKSSDGHEPKKSRMKRSRTSLPSSRFSLPGTILQREQIERQTWIKHQEIALGKSGKRNHWEDRWAILNRRNLYLCVESPSFNTEKAVELGSHTRVDVRNSIVDIAYDWLSSSFTKQRHVVRIVTQNRSEHLIELNTESEMLSWISVLQSSSEDVPSNEEMATKENNNHVNASPNNLHNSQSIASLASSSCSTTTSELVTSTTTNTPTINENNQLVARNQLPTSKSFGGLSTTPSSSSAVLGGNSTPVDCAKNRLIMHRYIAKNSQLQSPTASKKMEMIGGPMSSGSGPAGVSTSCASQAGTSKDGLENGGNSDQSTTPKSGRKWKKSKAGKQGSGGTGGTGGGSSGGSTGSQQQGAAGGPLPVLGIKLADCPVGTLGEHVPMLVQICVSVVQTHGMDTVGIYRIPGNTAAVNALKESLSNRGFETIDPHNVEALDPRWRDVNVVSSLLKMFLRKLPEPLLTDKLYPFFIDANRIATHHNRLHKLRNLLRKLPRPHYDTLRFLILHLFEITKHSDVNKMECRNLALMFGPSIVRPSDDNMATMVTHMSDQCKIIETLIHYHEWMFDENSTIENAVPEQHPGDGQNPLEPGSYGVGVPTGVSAASFNDMHNLIRKANEDQAAAMMNEGKGQKIKNMLRRNSRRDKSKSKLKIESTAPAAMNPRGAAGAWVQPTPSNTSAASVESAFCGNYQERDIDAEIESRQTISPQMTSGSVDGVETTSEARLDQSPSLESSLGSLPDTSRTEPIGIGYSMDDEEAKEAARRKRQEEMYSARRIFIAGNAAGTQPEVGSDAEKAAIDALANHSQHLHIANSPAFEVLSEETREKIRRMQKKQSWHDTKEIRADLLKTYSPTKDLTDALSCTSDYSTTSSAPLSANPPLAVACVDQPNSSSDYASSDPSPCARNLSTSPASRPSNLGLSPSQMTSASPDCQPVVMSRSQKIRMRTKAGLRDPERRHTIADMDALKQGRLDKLARWFGLRKSSPDVSRDESELIDEKKKNIIIEKTTTVHPPEIVKTSPNELTPVSGDELL